jgi:tetratricopeptide (TPR) repeat protein
MSERDVAILRSLADRIDPEDAGAHNNLGVVFFQKGLVEDAIEAFERALELDPRLEVARRNAEVAFLESGGFRRGSASCGRLFERTRTDVEPGTPWPAPFSWAATRGRRPGQWGELLAVSPESVALHMKLAYAEAERGRIQVAVHLLERGGAPVAGRGRRPLQLAELLVDTGMPVRAERGSTASAGARTRKWPTPTPSFPHPGGAGRRRRGRGGPGAGRRLLDPDAGPSRAAHLSLERYRETRSAAAALTRRATPARGDAGHAASGFARATELRRSGGPGGRRPRSSSAPWMRGTIREVRQSLAEIRLLQGEVQRAADCTTSSGRAARTARSCGTSGAWRSIARRLDEAVDAYRRTVALDSRLRAGLEQPGRRPGPARGDGAAERALRKAAGARRRRRSSGTWASSSPGPIGGRRRWRSTGGRGARNRPALSRGPAWACALFQAGPAEARTRCWRRWSWIRTWPRPGTSSASPSRQLGDSRARCGRPSAPSSSSPSSRRPATSCSSTSSSRRGAAGAGRYRGAGRAGDRRSKAFEFEPAPWTVRFGEPGRRGRLPSRRRSCSRRARTALRRGQLARAAERRPGGGGSRPTDAGAPLLEGEVYLRRGWPERRWSASMPCWATAPGTSGAARGPDGRAHGRSWSWSAPRTAVPPPRRPQRGGRCIARGSWPGAPGRRTSRRKR